MGHGGARKPDHKPRVSGPGSLSRRTDMDSEQPQRLPTGLAYGEGKALEAQSAAVPVPEGGAMGEGASGAPMAPEGGLGALLSGAPTQRPGEDIMTGLGPAPLPASTMDAINAVEMMIQNSKVVPAGLMQLYEMLTAEVV